LVIIYGTSWAEVDAHGLGVVEPESEVALNAVVHVTAVAVLTTCSTVSVDIGLTPETLTGLGVDIVSVDHGNTVGLDASTGGVWVEVVIIAVLAVPEAFVLGVNVLEVVLTGDTRVLEFIVDTDVASLVLALAEFTVVSVSNIPFVACAASDGVVVLISAGSVKGSVTEARFALITSWTVTGFTVRMADV